MLKDYVVRIEVYRQDETKNLYRFHCLQRLCDKMYCVVSCDVIGQEKSMQHFSDHQEQFLDGLVYGFNEQYFDSLEECVGYFADRFGIKFPTK